MSAETGSKLFSVRVPADELAHVEALFAEFPGASPALVIRALLYRASTQKLAASQALSLHGIWKVKGGKP